MQAYGWWEDSDQLNLVATFLDPKSIGAVRPPAPHPLAIFSAALLMPWVSSL